MKRVLALLCCTLLLTVSAAGCGTPQNANKTINVRLAAEPATLDPQVASGGDAASVIAALYEGLCRVDGNGNATTGVASSWQANGDCTQYTFHLRSNAVWNGNVANLASGQDGGSPTAVTAQDFVFAWRRALQPDTASPVCAAMMCLQNAVQVHTGVLSTDQLGVTAQDSHTLVVRLRYSCPDFPQLTAQSIFMPCSEAFFNSAAGRYGMERSTILGNGAFIIPNYGWAHQQSLTLKRSDNYQSSAAVLPSSLVFLMGGVSAGTGSSSSQTNSIAATARPAEILQALTSAKLDISALALSSESAAKKAGLTVTSYRDTTCGLCFNTGGTFRSAQLRRAFVQSLDRTALMQLLPAGTQAASDILPPETRFGGKAYRSQAGSGMYLQPDASAARKGQALLPANRKITLLCTQETKALASQMLASWNQAFQTYFSLSAVDETTLLSSVTSGSYDIAIYPYTPATADAYTALADFQSGQSGNFTQFKDSSYDQLLAGTIDSQTLAHAEKYLCDNAVFYPLYYARHAWAAQPTLTGVLYRPFGGGLNLCGAGKSK